MVKTLIFALLATMCATFLWGCGGKVSYTTVDGTMLGTTLHVVADVQGTSPQELYAAVMALDREAKASMSIFDPASLLSRLNRNQTDSVDRHIAFNLRLADSISSLSDGRYDVTVKPLVEAWGFAGKEAQENPNVDSILAFVGRQKVRIENGRLIKDDPRVQLDFNSIAKGYTVDLRAQLVELVRRQELHRRHRRRSPLQGRQPAGESVAHRHRDPVRRQHVERRIPPAAYRDDRRRPGHLGQLPPFLPRCQRQQDRPHDRPPHGAQRRFAPAVVTVSAPTCAEADALGTMFLAMGADDALAAAKSMPRMKVYFILADGADGYEEYVSPAMKAAIMQ